MRLPFGITGEPRGRSHWTGPIIIAFAALSFLDDTRRVLAGSSSLTGQLGVIGCSFLISAAIVGVVLRCHWFNLCCLVAAALVHILSLAMPTLSVSSQTCLTVTGALAIADAAFRGERNLVLIGAAIYIPLRIITVAVNPAGTGRLLFAEFPAVAITAGVGGYVGATVRCRWAAEEKAALLSTARQRERALLARELHDVVAHELTIIAMQASVMRLAQDKDSVESARDSIERTSRAALDELKRLLQVLRSSEAVSEVSCADDLSLQEVVDGVVEHLRRLGHPVEVDIAAGELPRSVELAAEQVLRESSTNVLKHSPAGSSVSLTVRREEGTLFVRVTNDGFGQDPEQAFPSTRLGLSGLEERLSLLGGELTAGPEQGRWVVVASLPIAPPETA
ncbi:sensor histidine kinase [Austwickia chelonae]|uniref:sensor histidine kinase n=1 Tax=Austwickia chelonae TaxID=100225 RepID=UPI000E2615C4|nr:histidine kinase [Austwickia chelonae]